MFDVYSIVAFDARKERATYELNMMDGFWSAQDCYCFLNTFKYHAEKVVLDTYSLFEAQRHRTIFNWLAYFSAESLDDELARAGLVTLERYADVAGTPYHVTSSEFAVVVGASTRSS